MISVVIPAYNAGKTLKTCLDSLLCQTYPDLELIVVDDGSSDKTTEIVSEMIQTDPRIRLIRQQNAGVSVARNAGMDAAQGDLVAFVDADDTVSENFIETLNDLYAPDTLPVADVVRTDGTGSALTPIPNEIQLDNGWIDRYFCGDIRYGVVFAVWNKLFSAELLRREDLRFPTELTIGEDMLFTFEYLTHCRNIRFSDAAQYNYTIAEGSAMSANKDYAPLYDKTFQKLRSDPRIPRVTQGKWAFEATLDLMARPFVLNRSRTDFAVWWKGFRQTPLCQAAIGSEKPKSMKRRLFHAALRFKRPTCVHALVALMRIKKSKG